ncbi:MAG: hypothetical protein ACI9P7_000102 [Candidatus Azotimanducaceae bacterium]|jgi:hypothetical protein
MIMAAKKKTVPKKTPSSTKTPQKKTTALNTRPKKTPTKVKKRPKETSAAAEAKPKTAIKAKPESGAAKKRASDKKTPKNKQPSSFSLPLGIEELKAAPKTAPRVTVFGGGVAGLSAAHELIEHGFDVQVVEERQSHFEEYACEVGGFAASQYERIKKTEELYPQLLNVKRTFPEWRSWDAPPDGGDVPDTWKPTLLERPIKDDEDHTNFNAVKELRAQKMRSVQKMIPFTDNIRFNPDPPGREKDDRYPDPDPRGKDILELMLTDEVNRTNLAKLNSVAARILEAIYSYREDLIIELMLIAGEEKNTPREELHKRFGDATDRLETLDPDVRLRETFLLQVQGHYGTDDEDMPLRAWNRAVLVKQQLIKIIEESFEGHLNAIKKLSPREIKKKSDKASKHLLERRYREDITLKTVIWAHHNVWGKIGFLPDPKKSDRKVKVGSEVEVDHEIKNYLLAMISPSEERPPAASVVNSPIDIIKDAVSNFHRVGFEVVEHVMPGEHGYRFFPSFYKNLFEMMRRTPVLDANQIETSATIFDNLVMPPPTTFADIGKSLKFKLNRHDASKSARRENLKATAEFFGATQKDGMMFENRMLKYMSSCQERRKLYENMSWLEFAYGYSELEEPDPEAAFHAESPYSEAYQRVIRRMPQALVAMRAGESDARSFGSCTIQMFKDYGKLSDDVDMVLNGPTSDAWLRPWKAYLKHQGVRFYVGHIDHLAWANDGKELVPVSKGPSHYGSLGGYATVEMWEMIEPLTEPTIEPFSNHKPLSERPHIAYQEPTVGQTWSDGTPVDYFVMAIPFQEQARLFVGLDQQAGTNKLDGDLEKIRTYVMTTNPHAMNQTPDHGVFDLLGKEERDGLGQPKHRFRQPLRDFTGIQYFFDRRVRIQGGHSYYLNAQWGLTSLPQAFLWRHRPSKSAGYLGHLSVDLGDPYAPWTQGTDATGKSVWQSARWGVAEGAWDQITATFPEEMRRILPDPNFYHIDRALSFESNSRPPKDDAWGKSGVIRNTTPFLIQLPGQFHMLAGKRVKVDPTLAERTEFTYPTEPTYDDFDNIYYSLSKSRWVIAGSMAQTYTRLNSMEASNESARHAVNSILASVADQQDSTADWWEGKPGVFCDVHNNEKDEDPDLNFLKRLDRELMKQGLPHVLDILESMEHLKKIPETPTKLSKSEQLKEVAKGLGKVYGEVNTDNHQSNLMRMLESHVNDQMGMVKEVVSWIKKRNS